jgi:hypothetical protein
MRASLIQREYRKYKKRVQLKISKKISSYLIAELIVKVCQECIDKSKSHHFKLTGLAHALRINDFIFKRNAKKIQKAFRPIYVRIKFLCKNFLV